MATITMMATPNKREGEVFCASLAGPIDATGQCAANGKSYAMRIWALEQCPLVN